MSQKAPELWGPAWRRGCRFPGLPREAVGQGWHPSVGTFPRVLWGCEPLGYGSHRCRQSCYARGGLGLREELGSMGRTAWQRCPVPTSLSGSRLCLSPFCAALTKPLSPYHLWRIKFSQFWSSEVSDQVCSRFVVVTGSVSKMVNWALHVMEERKAMSSKRDWTSSGNPFITVLFYSWDRVLMTLTILKGPTS